MFGAAPLGCVLIEIALGGLGEGELAGSGKFGGRFGGPLAGQGIDACAD